MLQLNLCPAKPITPDGGWAVSERGRACAGWCWPEPPYAQQSDRAIATASNLNYAYTNLPTQPVGPDDLLALSVYDSPELTRTVRVDADGNIRLPMLKDPIPVRGLVPSQLETTIARSLTEGNVLVDPIVTVTIVEYQSRPVNVVGAVKNPLVFQATTAHSAAGCDRPRGRDERRCRLRHCRQPGGHPDGKPARVTQTIPVRKLIDNADPSVNVMLHGGEEVLVPEAQKIYVVGNVKKPGAYPIRNDEETTILQLAGSLRRLIALLGESGLRVSQARMPAPRRRCRSIWRRS